MENKLGVFHIGRQYSLETKQPGDHLLYDSKDLVTHAVCVGMTGSGKTGLCIGLLEEAALDKIPALIIDPKGDLANLLLTFPDLRPEDFAPWVNLDDAARKGIPPEDYPAQQATLWREGLAKWGLSGADIANLRANADMAIYTPGSTSGIPLSVLKSFEAPKGPAAEDNEIFQERVQATTTSLLGLLGIEADPVQSQQHILLANLLNHAWSEGRNLDLATLIQQIQTPPFERVGVLEVEAFYPSKERFKLAMQINNLLASPGFAQWMEGEPLEVANLLYTPQGKPRLAIVSIAHLSDAERMFVVSLILNQTLAWMRQQPGTTSLRAILYMDEIFGYFPPVANPPSKLPLLTMLKQARAFGLGVVLATQNPVDLDYKGLANAGTWFIGRLQTERDKQRVLEGLEGASASAGSKFDRAGMEETLAGLGNRIFLMNNVHDDAPTIFETRWAMSYLRGPLTKQQIKQLTGDRPAPASTPPPAAALPPADKTVTGHAIIRYTDAKAKLDTQKEVFFTAPIDGNLNTPDWNEGIETEKSAEGTPVPANVAAKWQRAFCDWLAANQTLELFRSARFKVTSQPDESERDFKVHLQQLAREQRDAEVAQFRQKYAPKIAALEDKIHRAEQAVQRESQQAQSSTMSVGIDIAKGVLGVLLGGSKRSAIGGLGTAARGYGRQRQQSADVDMAKQNVERFREEHAALQAELEEKCTALQAEYDSASDDVETIAIRPKKAGIQVKALLLPNA